MKPAVFLDRDGTIIEQVDYLSRPDQVRLIPGAAEAIRSLRLVGFSCVLITNQSAIGRGLLTPEGLEDIHREMHRQLAQEGAELDGVYFCPHAPTVSDRTTIEHPDRKPGPGMILRAARELDLDVSRSWMVGDMLSDLLAGANAGCQGTILVLTGHGLATSKAQPEATFVAKDLLTAAHLIIVLQSLGTDERAAGKPSGHGPQRPPRATAMGLSPQRA